MWKKLLTVTLIFIASVVLLIMLSLFAFQRFDAFVRYTDAVDEHYILLSDLNKLKLHLNEMESNQRAFLLFEDSTFLTHYELNDINIRQTFASIHERTREQPDQQNRLRSLNLVIKSRLDYLKTGIIMGDPPSDYKLGRKYMERAIGLITEMENAQHATLREVIETKEFYQDNTPQNFRVVFILTMTVFAISFALLIQQYRDRYKYQRQLERNIVELNQANAEWEQIAHAASHDLQEPLRKIRTFSGILQSRYINQLDDEGQILVKRIDVASSRAQSLMHDIVNYNLVVYPREELSPVDLNYAFNNARSEFEKQIGALNAGVFVDHLPLVRAYPSQIELLFKCLIDNSIKFARQNDQLKITVTATIVQHKELPIDQPVSFSHYHKVVFEDNGIGFENQFSERIFKMFQRLHAQESAYDGRGIGLTIVKRIMTNHMGTVNGRGRPGKGAKFTLYFPVR